MIIVTPNPWVCGGGGGDTDNNNDNQDGGGAGGGGDGGGEGSGGGEDDSCTLTPSYLCQLSEEDQDRIANGQSYLVDVTSEGDALDRIATYGVLIALPTAIVEAPAWVSLLVTYLGGFASGAIAEVPGTQEGDVMVSVGQAVGEEFEYGGHTYNTEVVTNTYYFRDDELIWTETEVTTAYPTSRTY